MWCVLESIVIKLASTAESITAHEMSVNAYFMPVAMSTCICVVQANVFICGVVVLDVRWVAPNC